MNSWEIVPVILSIALSLYIYIYVYCDCYLLVFCSLILELIIIQ